jgi:hypothetical protein
MGEASMVPGLRTLSHSLPWRRRNIAFGSTARVNDTLFGSKSPRFTKCRCYKPCYFHAHKFLIMNRRAHRELQSIDRLPKRDWDALTRTIEAFLQNDS